MKVKCVFKTQVDENWSELIFIKEYLSVTEELCKNLFKCFKD